MESNVNFITPDILECVWLAMSSIMLDILIFHHNVVNTIFTNLLCETKQVATVIGPSRTYRNRTLCIYMELL